MGAAAAWRRIDDVHRWTVGPATPCRTNRARGALPVSRSRALWSKAAAPALGNRTRTAWSWSYASGTVSAFRSLCLCMSGAWTTSGVVRCTACTCLTMMNQTGLVYGSSDRLLKARGQGSLINRPHGVAKWERVGACLTGRQTPRLMLCSIEG